MYEAKVIKVMIASPGDVSVERRVIRDVILGWNDVHAEDRKLVLMSVGWETHSSPDMADRAQAVINKQILKDCDLLVAVFWTRLGSPTGTSSSGTVEEIEEHLAAGKPAMIYFSSQPVRLDSVDSEQYSALKEFKASCMQRGLVEEYEDPSRFRDKFTRQLAQTIIRRFSSDNAGTATAQLPGSREIPFLTLEARQLLLEAVQDSSGVIMRLESMNGTHISTNNREFVQDGGARSEARWRGAVDELARVSLIEDRGGGGSVLFVTDAGYRTADLLRLGD